MNNKNFYIDIHVLQTVPPSCINRDDTGSPKTAIYGGTPRARVSSQAWKKAMRNKFHEIFDEKYIGKRTKKVGDLIAQQIKLLDSSIDDEKALKMAADALSMVNITLSKKKSNQTDVLMFLSDAQAKAVAELRVNECKDKKKYLAALDENPSIDMSLFGRMVAADPSLNFDAAAQVAHSISTHTVHNEYDYFTAVDDLSEEDTSGAGHLGTIEFNSSTLYRYATVNANELYQNLGDLTAKAIRGFVQAFVLSMPTGKQNTFANLTFPDFVYVAVREDQSVNLCGAFEKPISSRNGGYLEESEKALLKYADKVYENYASAPIRIWGIGDEFDEKQTFPQILDSVETAVKEHFSEGEVE